MKILGFGKITAAILLAAGCSGCSSSRGDNAPPGDGSLDPAVPYNSGGPGTSYAVGDTMISGALVDTGQGGGSDAAVSKMTAGLWDDNANFDVFKQFVAQQAQIYPDSLPAFDLASIQAAHDASLQRVGSNSIDIALVLDTTSSMSDELSYLQTEFEGISSSVTQKFPNVATRWSLVLYRDIGDQYVTRAFDFTTNVESFRANLAAQSSDGGGDEPEDVPAALGLALNGSWRGAPAAQTLIWVTDAPHHDNDATAVRDLLSQSRARGIHIYPVAASSANALAEATMRIAAQITTGRYLFLTDDSGIGNSHSEPKVPCYIVTTLGDAITRSIAMELSGNYVEPTPSSIVRIVGKPNGATCDNVTNSQTDAGVAQTQ